MKAAIFSNHSPRVGFGVDRKMVVSRSQVMVVAASRNHLYRRRLQVVIDAGPRNHLYLLGQQVKIRSNPRNQIFFTIYNHKTPHISRLAGSDASLAEVAH